METDGQGPVEYEECRIVQWPVHVDYDKKDKEDRSHTSVLHGPGLGPRAGPARSPWAGPGRA